MSIIPGTETFFGIATAFAEIDEHMKEMINKVAELGYKMSTPAALSLAS